MRLDSVRELKASLTDTLLAPLATAAVASRSLNISTRPFPTPSVFIAQSPSAWLREPETTFASPSASSVGP